MAEKFCKDLQANPERAQGWCNSYADAEAKGFCRPLTEEELKDSSPNVHYIQTFCVHQPHKPSHPYRLVVAANQKMGEEDGKKSMNDLLYTGPNLLKDLTSLIIRARLAIFMLLADISRFFQRITMSSEDAHYQRFIALRMGENGKVKKVHSLFSSLSFGLNALQFIATQILRTDVSKWHNNDYPIKIETAKDFHESCIVLTSYLPWIMKKILSQ